MLASGSGVCYCPPGYTGGHCGIKIESSVKGKLEKILDSLIGNRFPVSNIRIIETFLGML